MHDVVCTLYKFKKVHENIVKFTGNSFFFKFALSLFDQKIGALDPRKERSSGRLRFFPVHLFDHWMMGVYHCKLTFINLDKPHDQ